MGSTIRKANAEDANYVGEVHTKSWQAAYNGVIPDEYLSSLSPQKRTERFKNQIEEYKDTTFYYVAEFDDQIVGTLVLHKCRDDDIDETGEIGAIYLIPEYWDKGFGLKLMDFSVATLKEMGFSSISLWVLEGNIRARRFYEKCGFTFDGTKKEINIGKALIELRYRKGI